MGDLRIKAQNILKLKQQERENESQKRDLSLEDMINNRKNVSKIEFTDRIQQEINGFHYNLLTSANMGEPLNIDILELEDDTFSRKDSSSVKTLIKYLPIKQKVATFLKETNFEFVTDDIITDDTLQKLYSMICENDIYPIWKIRRSSTNQKAIILYLEINPLISFKERTEELKKKVEHRKKLENHAVTLYVQNLKELEQIEKKSKISDFLLTFFSTLYISVVILTFLFNSSGLFPVEKIADTLLWPYSLFTEFRSLFILSFPIGVIFSLFMAYKKS